MAFALTIAAAILAVSGIIVLASGSVLAGVLLLVLACVVGPGGYSLSRR